MKEKRAGPHGARNKKRLSLDLFDVSRIVVEPRMVGAEEFESSNDGFKDRCLKPLDYTPVYMGDVIITHHPCLLLVRISEEYILFI